MGKDDDLRGAPVYDAQGEVGRVVDVAPGADDRSPGGLWVALAGEERPVLIPAAQIGDASNERVSLTVTRDQVLGGKQSVRVPLHEEVLEATTHPVERGTVRIHKTVETEPVARQVTVGHEEVAVERVPVDELVDQAPAPRWEGDTLVVPLVEEVLIVEKRLRVREELRVTRTRTEDQQTIREELRREVADVETTGEVDTGAAS